MNKALLDTDIYAEILRDATSPVVAHARAYRQIHGRLTVSVITIMEMITGFQKAQQPHRIKPLLTLAGTEEVLEFNQSSCVLAGRIWGDLERTGQSVGSANPMIAAIALEHALELVTGDVSRYQKIRELGYSLNIVDWRL